MSAVGTAATTVEAAATTTAVEATATAVVAAMEAAAGVHAATVEAAAVVACEALVGLGVVARSVVGRTSGATAEASVAGMVCGDLIAAGEVGGHAASGIVRGHVIAAYERSTIAGVVACACIAHSAGAPVEASVGTVIGVTTAPADVVVSTVVPVVAAAPISAVKPGAKVTEAVVNAAVVADGRAPVTSVPEVAAGAIAPVAGGPESVDVGRHNPSAVDPLVAVTGPGPVAGGPDVAVAGSDGLFVDRDGGRRHGNRDKDACVGGSGSDREATGKNCSADRIFEQPGELHQFTFLPLPSLCPDFPGLRGLAGLRFPLGWCLSSGSGTHILLDTGCGDLLHKGEW
jgi:hypothetical protein